MNPATIRRVRRLYCRNERAVIRMRLAGAREPFVLVPVGAILVGSIHLNFVPVTLRRSYHGPLTFTCVHALRKGDEMGYFHHGSAIIVVAPRGFRVRDHVRPGTAVRMGNALLTHPGAAGRNTPARLPARSGSPRRRGSPADSIDSE